MRSCILLPILALHLPMLNAQSGSFEPGGLLSQLTVARFVGSGSETIQAMTSDAAGNIYVAGTTTSSDLPMKNAMQPSMGGYLLMRSLDRGMTWENVPSPPTLPVTITPDPNEPQTLFVGDSDGLFKTVDGGRTWRRIYYWTPSVFGVGSGVSILIDPANTRKVYAYTVDTSSTRIFASDDAGESWQLRETPQGQNGLLGVGNLWVDPNGSGTIGFGEWYSRDQGRKWTKMTIPNSERLSLIRPDPHHSGWIYAAITIGGAGKLFLSKDLGTTWTELAIPNQLAIVDLLFDPDLPSVLYAPSTGPMPVLNVSDDAGVSWRTIRNPDNHYYLNRMALLSRQCGGGGLFSVSGSSFDFGATWQPGQISRVIVVAAGPGCAIYAIRSIASDAFIAKLAPGGSEVIWSTYLGGSDTDASAALALDAQGNVYVAGNTASADFPTTAPLAGSMGHVFVVKLDPDGKLIYSVIYGGESTDAAAALAVNGSGEAHLVGWLGAGANGGAFLIKLRRDGSTAYVSYLPKIATYEYQPLSLNPPRAIAVIAEENGSVLIGGYAGMLLRMNPDGYLLSDLPRLPGRIFAMETDDKGNIYVAGQVTGYGSGVRSKGCFEGYYYHSPSTLAAGDIFVTKLKPDSLQEVFSARLFGDCQSWPSTIKVGPTGEITVGLWTFSNFPVRYPVLASLSCYVNGAAAVSRLSADGSTLLFSSFLDMCVNAPLVAHAPDGSIYAGVAKAISPYTISTHSAILRIPFPQPDSLAIEKVVNAFSGVPGFPSDGMLLTITGQNLAAKFIDLGLNNPNPLPTELGGVQVLFDSVAAQMLQVAPDRLICVLPPKTQNQNTVNIQVVNGPQRSSPSVQRLFLAGVGLLTHYFPALPPSGSVDGVILNADGTLNDAQHPAAPGSTVVLFGTGVTGPGSIPLLWNAPQQKQNETIYPLLGTARHMPGFIDAMYAIDFRIPDAPGPGVYVVPVRGRLTRMEIGLAGSGIGVWVK